MTSWKHREKMVFCRILRFLKNELENCILCTISNFCKQITRIATHLIVFSSKSWKFILSKKKDPFAYKVDAGALFKEKAPLFFWKNAILRKIEKRRLKRRLLLLWSYGCQESKRHLFFWPRTNRVWFKSAFWLLNIQSNRFGRGFLECFSKSIASQNRQSFQKAPSKFGNLCF